MIITPKPKKNLLKKTFKLIEIILTIAVIFICTIIIVQRASNNEKSFFGYRLFKVETGSMFPKYKINDVIFVKEVDTKQIQEGDDVVYIGNSGEYNGRMITHQVIRKEIDGDDIKFYTKGIANNTEDPVVLSSQIIGVVQYKIYTLTIITNILLNPYTLYFLIVLPITIKLFFNEIHSKDKKERYIAKKVEELKKEDEKKKNETGLVKKKRGQIIINETKNKSVSSKNKKT